MKAQRVKSAATTNSTLIIAGSNKRVTGWSFSNNTAGKLFFKFYDKATAPTVGTDTPAFTMIIPANGQISHNNAEGIPFELGIGFGITGAVGDTDTTATSADDVHGVVTWK